MDFSDICLHEGLLKCDEWYIFDLKETLHIPSVRADVLYSEIIAVCSDIHTNTLCGQNVELLNVKLVVHIVTTGL